ncbi:MAG: hypothetical protein ACUZ8H_14055 [Candidatus Anammoxibacter sp.]
MIDHKFNMGDRLKDIVSGYEGIVMNIAQYSTGCVHYGLDAQNLKDGKTCDWEFFDTSRLVLIEAEVVKFDLVRPVSGPCQNPPQG